MNFKVPTSKEEMDALRLSMNELSDDELDAVSGGNDDLQGKLDQPTEWTCPFCGQVLLLKMAMDGPKHVTQDCPNNPYK